MLRKANSRLLLVAIILSIICTRPLFDLAGYDYDLGDAGLLSWRMLMRVVVMVGIAQIIFVLLDTIAQRWRAKKTNPGSAIQ